MFGANACVKIDPKKSAENHLSNSFTDGVAARVVPASAAAHSDATAESDDRSRSVAT
jgi:hypothetical protein